MTNEEIKTLADGYYAGNADWLNKEQEQDTKVGWRQGFAYALRQFAVSNFVLLTKPNYKAKDGTIKRGIETIKQTLEWYDGKTERTNTKDGRDYKYSMKKDYRTKLETLIK